MADLDSHGQAGRRVRVTPLVFGAAFVAIGVVHLTGVDDATWAWVIGLTALAVAGLVSAIRA